MEVFESAPGLPIAIHETNVEERLGMMILTLVIYTMVGLYCCCMQPRRY